MNGQNRLVYLVRRMVLRFFSDGIPQAAAALSYFLLFSQTGLLQSKLTYLMKCRLVDYYKGQDIIRNNE